MHSVGLSRDVSQDTPRPTHAADSVNTARLIIFISMRRAAVRRCTPSGRAWSGRQARCSWSFATAAAAGGPRPCSKTFWRCGDCQHLPRDRRGGVCDAYLVFCSRIDPTLLFCCSAKMQSSRNLTRSVMDHQLPTRPFIQTSPTGGTGGRPSGSAGGRRAAATAHWSARSAAAAARACGGPSWQPRDLPQLRGAASTVQCRAFPTRQTSPQARTRASPAPIRVGHRWQCLSTFVGASAQKGDRIKMVLLCTSCPGYGVPERSGGGRQRRRGKRGRQRRQPRATHRRSGAAQGRPHHRRRARHLLPHHRLGVAAGEAQPRRLVIP